MTAPPATGARPTAVTLSFRIYVVLLCTAVAVFLPLGVLVAIRSPGHALLWDALLWIVCIAAANFRNVPTLPGVGLTTTVVAPLTVAASVLLPFPLAVPVVLLGRFNEREFRRGTSGWNIAFNRAQGALTAGVTTFAASFIVSPPTPAGIPRAGGLPKLFLCTALAGVVFMIVNQAAVTVGMACRYRLGLRKAARTSAAPFPHYAAELALTYGLALLIVVLYARVNHWSILLLALPLWMAYNALRSTRESEDREEELSARVRGLEMLNRLGTELLTARRREQVEIIGNDALRTALDSTAVAVSLDGDVPSELQGVKVPGGGGAAIGVPAETAGQSMEVVEAAARLLGMALQRLELEEELAEQQRARATLASKIVEEATHERSRIALDIHDEVLPFLAAAEIQADNVRSAISGADPARARELAAAMRDAVNGGVTRLRDLLDALAQQIVVPGGLRPALVKTLGQLHLEHGIEGQLKAPEPLPELPLAVEILVLEVVRGCLGNVAKHAHARTVVVELDVTDALITVQVRDDGRGFDPAHVPAGRHGLALMQQRVELARGRFTVRSGDSGGTKVEVEVPL
ncbi:MAG: sensor histidine kinase [Egibacteraceae bacterium]